MNLLKLDKYISELLFEHDCVVLPNFGGFVANPESAKIDYVKNRFSPPYKEISFNINLKKNDGLIANHIIEKESVSYTEAIKFIEDFVSEALKDLDQNKSIVFKEIGTIYKDVNEKIRFQPSYEVNYNLDAFGLKTFSFPQLNREEPIQQEEKKTEPLVIPIQKQENKKERNLKPLLYAAALIPFITYLFWIPAKTDLLSSSGNFTYADLNPFTDKICSEYSKRISLYDVVEKPDETLSLNWLHSKNSYEPIFFSEQKRKKLFVKLSTAEPESTKVSITNRGVKIFHFHIIGGCFASYSNAQNFINQLNIKGYKAELIDKYNGLYRVAYQSYETRKEAKAALNEIKNKHQSSAWMLVK